MLIIIIIIVIIISLLYIITLYKNYLKYKKQMELYDKAKEMSITKKKKLLVIGNPIEATTNYIFGSYGCGDICTDINGCDNVYCNNIKNIKDDLVNVIGTFATDSVVIFESEVLEYIPKSKISYVLDEMYRVSNNDIFSVHELYSDSIFTYIKEFGYEVSNYLFNKPVFKINQYFSDYPPLSKKYIYN